MFPIVTQFNREEIVIFGGSRAGSQVKAEDNCFVLHVPTGSLRKENLPEVQTKTNRILQVSGS